MLACHAADPISIPRTDDFRSLNYGSLCARVPWAGKRCISVKMLLDCCWTLALVSTLNEPLHNKTNNMTCAPLKTDQTWAHWSFCCGAAQISSCQSVLLHAIRRIARSSVVSIELHYEKTCLRDFVSGETQNMPALMWGGGKIKVPSKTP